MLSKFILNKRQYAQLKCLKTVTFEGFVRRFSINQIAADDSLNDDDDDGNSVATNAFMGSGQQVRPKLRIHNVLASKNPAVVTLADSSTVDEAINHLVENQLSASLVLNSDGEVSGLYTARDLLRYMSKMSDGRSNGKHLALESSISDVMTKKEKLIHCSPNDSVSRCKAIMYKLKVRHIPCIEGSEVLGIVTGNDLSDSGFSLIETGGKKGFMEFVTGRKGLSEGVKLKKMDPNAVIGKVIPRLDVDVAAFSKPHPYKWSNGCASTRRNYGADELCEDDSLCEGQILITC